MMKFEMSLDVRTAARGRREVGRVWEPQGNGGGNTERPNKARQLHETELDVQRLDTAAHQHTETVTNPRKRVRSLFEPAQAAWFALQPAQAGGGTVQQLALDLGTPTRMGLASTRGRFYIQRGTKCMGPSTG